MKKGTLTVLLLLSLLISSLGSSQPTGSGICYAQSKPAKGEAKQEPPPTPNQTTRPALAFGLEDGTPIKMRITRTISSADAKVDEEVDFEVLEETKIGDVVVIPRGGIAWGTVTEAQPK